MKDYNNPGKSVSIDVDDQNVPYVVNESGYVYYYKNYVWNNIPRLSKEIAVADGSAN